MINEMILIFLCQNAADEPRQNQGRGLVDRKLVNAPSNFYCWPSQGGSSAFGSLVIIDVARCYLWLFTLYINIVSE